MLLAMAMCGAALQLAAIMNVDTLKIIVHSA